MNQFEEDPTSQLLKYHTELMQMCESVRAMYSRYLPLFILACAETAALFVSCAIKLGSDPAMNMIQRLLTTPNPQGLAAALRHGPLTPSVRSCR